MAKPLSIIARSLRKPALHFVVIGSLLFVWQRAGSGAVPASNAVAREPIVVSLERLQELRDSFAKLTGRPPSEAEERPLLGEFLDEEILYREARARGLDRNDRSVRWRLVEKMRFLGGDENGDPEQLYREALELGLDRDDAILRRLLSEKMRLLIQLGAVQEAPADTALQEFYAEHAEDYRQAARVTLTQVFLSADKRGAQLASDAAALRAELARGEAPRLDKSLSSGDVFPLGQHFKESSERSLAKLFGPDFAAAALRAPAGAWSQPIRSAYGLHLVWVYSRTDAAIPPFDAVRNQVRQRYLNERRERAFKTELARLRASYDVRRADSDVTRPVSDYFEETT
jgi:hypothetical protein